MEAVAICLIGALVVLVAILSTVIVHMARVLAEQNRRLLNAIVAETPKDFGILEQVAKEDHGRTPGEQARFDQDEATRRDLQAKIDDGVSDQLRGMGYEPRQVGT